MPLRVYQPNKDVIAMETSLHRALKQLYAANADAVEVVVGRYRIDAIDACGCLVEIQHAGLGSIRSKIQDLVREHSVRVIKPLIQTKILEKLEPRSHRVLSRRRSPKKATHLDVFAELIHFTSVFPHDGLTIEVPLLQVVESRIPKKNARWKRKQYKIIEQKVTEVGEAFILSTHDDLWRLLAILIFRRTSDPRRSPRG